MKPKLLLITLAAISPTMLPSCATAPTPAQASAAKLAGSATALVIGAVAPEAAPFTETAAAAIRSLPAGGTAPTAASVQSEVALWVGALPIAAAEKAKMVATVTKAYAGVLPKIQVAENTAAGVEDFADGLGGGLKL